MNIILSDSFLSFAMYCPLYDLSCSAQTQISISDSLKKGHTSKNSCKKFDFTHMPGIV